VLEFDRTLSGVSGNSADLPEDYRHTLGVKARVKFLNAIDEFKKDQEITITNVQRIRTGTRGVENAYKEPSHRKVYRRISGTKLFIDAGENLQLVSVTVDYIKKSSQVYLNPDSSVNFDLEANNSTIPFPDDIVREINRTCTINFMENTENRRLGTSSQQKQAMQE
jgi:hypothetical protein